MPTAQQKTPNEQLLQLPAPPFQTLSHYLQTSFVASPLHAYFNASPSPEEAAKKRHELRDLLEKLVAQRVSSTASGHSSHPSIPSAVSASLSTAFHLLLMPCLSQSIRDYFEWRMSRIASTLTVSSIYKLHDHAIKKATMRYHVPLFTSSLCVSLSLSWFCYDERKRIDGC